MERLTELFTDEYGHKCCALVGCKEVCEHGWTEDESGCRCDKVGEMQIRLAAYEDIGTPEQCAAGVALMQKQEQGLVVELPCRVGDTVYAHVPEFMRIGKFQVDMARLYGHKNIDFEANWAEHGELMADLDFEPNDIGKTVFLTRAEAENAIAND